MRNQGRFLELDALRGFAALSVMLYHFTVGFNLAWGHTPGLHFDFPRGSFGVNLFFMISGFVIFMTLDRTERPNDFIVGRFSRLYPVYWVSALITFTAVRVFGWPGKEQTVQTLLVNLTMLNSYFNIPSIDDSYWTLQLELSFYVFMFILYRWDRFRHLPWVLTVYLFLAAAYHHFRDISFLKKCYDLRIVNALLLEYIPYFALGIALYKIQAKNRKQLQAFLPILLIAYGVIGYVEQWDFVLFSLFAGLVFFLAGLGYLKTLRWKPLVFLGTISYPLYLTHALLGCILMRDLEGKGWSANWAVLMGACFSIFLATVLTYSVEKPVMDWLRRTYRRKWTPVPANNF